MEKATSIPKGNSLPPSEKKGRNQRGKLFIEVLLIVRNVLIINTDWNDKMTKETN